MGFRPRVSETRVYPLHHSLKKDLVRPERLARSRAMGAAVFKTARSSVPHTAAKSGRGGRSRTGTGNHAQRGLSPPCLRSNHAAKKLVRTEGIAPSWALAHRLLGPTCLLFHHVRKKLEHPRGRAPRSLPYQDSPSLSTGWMHGRSGRTCTFVARQGIAFTARCICCSATLRKQLGARAGVAPATVSL